MEKKAEQTSGLSQDALVDRLSRIAASLGAIDPNSKLGAPGVLLKRLVRKAIGWYSRPVHEFDRVLIELLQQIRQDIIRLQQVAAGDKVGDPSQHGEGAALAKLVSELVCEPFIIDVGANDGVTISNSLSFVEQGWRALMIEPAPDVYARLVANLGNLPNVTCLQVACAAESGVADLYYGSDGKDGFMSTLCTADNEWFRANRTTESVKVKTDRLTELLRQQQAPKQPGILLVDCEGMDYEALLGLDFSQYRPTVVVTEEYEWEPAKHAAKYSLLIRNGYSLSQKIGCNTIWLDRNAQRR